MRWGCKEFFIGSRRAVFIRPRRQHRQQLADRRFQLGTPRRGFGKIGGLRAACIGANLPRLPALLYRGTGWSELMKGSSGKCVSCFRGKPLPVGTHHPKLRPINLRLPQQQRRVCVSGT
jgi:hypothetical protein